MSTKRDGKGNKYYIVEGVRYHISWNPMEIPATTRCKHSKYACDRCGTSDRNDSVHTTINGKGLVASLRSKSKK